jgi:Leucine-rich repeat (LRR) protein
MKQSLTIKKSRKVCRKYLRFYLVVLGVLSIIACSSDGDGNGDPNVVLDTAKQITSFKFTRLVNSELGTDVIAVIDETAKTITAAIPFGVDVTALRPEITIKGSSITPNTTQDFSATVDYTVTAEDGSTQVYKVILTTITSEIKTIDAFIFLATNNRVLTNDVIAEINETTKTITATVPSGTDLTGLIPEIYISGAGVVPASDVAQNFGSSMSYMVTATDGSKQVYTVNIVESDREFLIEFFNANSENTLGWNLNDKTMNSWEGVTHNGGKVTALSLADKKISVLPYSFGNLVSLENLDLSKNEISILPYTLGNLVSLESLDLSKNEISMLPYTLGNLTALTHLELSDNKISIIPKQIGNLTGLTGLYFAKNNLSNIPMSIANLNNVVDVDFSENGSWRKIPEVLFSMTNIENLSFEGNILELHSVSKEIGNLVNLKSLNLSKTGAMIIPSEIGNLVNLKSLNLSTNMISRIPSEIGNLTSLDRLIITDNHALRNIPQVVCDLETNHGTTIEKDSTVTCR